MVGNESSSKSNLGQAAPSPLDAERDVLVKAVLNHVPFDGWSMESLRDVACEQGMSPDAPLRLFPGGIIDVVDHFTSLADRLMVEDWSSQSGEDQMGVREKVHTIIMLRFRRWTREKEAVRRALAVYAGSVHVSRVVRATQRTVDAVWRAAGDRSHDFNWYTKRVSLAGIYTAVLCYWLDDSSDNDEDTSQFVQRCLDGLVQGMRKQQEWQNRCSETLKTSPFLGVVRSFMPLHR